jgi:hypothetical protein
VSGPAILAHAQEAIAQALEAQAAAAAISAHIHSASSPVATLRSSSISATYGLLGKNSASGISNDAVLQSVLTKEAEKCNEVAIMLSRGAHTGRTPMRECSNSVVKDDNLLAALIPITTEMVVAAAGANDPLALAVIHDAARWLVISTPHCVYLSVIVLCWWLL